MSTKTICTLTATAVAASALALTTLGQDTPAVAETAAPEAVAATQQHGHVPAATGALTGATEGAKSVAPTTAQAADSTAASSTLTEAVADTAARTTRTVNVIDDAAWTIYTDPKTLTTAKATYIATVNSAGSTELTSIAKADSRIESKVITPNYLRDDHASPALVAATDGRIAAFHSSHGTLPVRYGVTDTTGKVATLSGPKALTGSGLEHVGATYAQVAHLPNANYKYYVFARANDNRWYFTRSKDLTSWTQAIAVAKDPFVGRPDAPANSSHENPYLEVSADRMRNRIHMAISTGYDDTGSNNRAYHFILKGDQVTNSTGTVVRNLDNAWGRANPLDPRRGTPITPEEGRSQLFDIATAPGGNPVVLTQHGNWSNFKRNYSTFDGTTWSTESITSDAKRGRSMALHQGNPKKVYLVRETTTGPEHLEEWTRSGAGTWTVRGVLPGKGRENWSPSVAEKGSDQVDALFWMRGTKPEFTRYDTAVVMETTGRAPVTIRSSSSTAGQVHVTTAQGIRGLAASGVPVTLRYNSQVIATGTTDRNGRVTLAAAGVLPGKKVMVHIPASDRWGAASTYTLVN